MKSRLTLTVSQAFYLWLFRSLDKKTQMVEYICTNYINSTYYNNENKINKKKGAQEEELFDYAYDKKGSKEE